MSKDDVDEWAWRLFKRTRNEEQSGQLEAREMLRELLHKNDLCLEGNPSDDVLWSSAWRYAFNRSTHKSLQITVTQVQHMLTPQDGLCPALDGSNGVKSLSYWQDRVPADVLHDMIACRKFKWHDADSEKWHDADSEKDPDGIIFGVDGFEFHQYVANLVQIADPTFSKPFVTGFYKGNKCVRDALIAKLSWKIVKLPECHIGPPQWDSDFFQLDPKDFVSDSVWEKTIVIW